ncbi:MAG: DUF29 domain-containing protein [Phormidesmis sp.]
MLKLKTLYDTDFNLWVEAQVAALQSRRLEALDLSNLIEEIEDLAKRDKKALRSHLKVLLLHLLKWQFQAMKRSRSWRTSITNARIEIEDVLSDSPSLKNYLPTIVDKAYANARTLACTETGLEIEAFPKNLPYKLSQVLDSDFLP